MTPRLPTFSYRKMSHVLRKAGFRIVGQHGSHVYFEHADGRRTVVPRHARKDIGRGLALKILRDAGIDPNRFR